MIRTERVSVSYAGRPVVRDVDLSVPRGSIGAIVGPSGCGKSSLLAALNRMTDLIPTARVEGRIFVDDTDVLASGTDPIALRRRVGMIFQKPNPFPLSIRRNVQLALAEHGTPRDRLDAITERVLRDVGLFDDVKDRLDAPAQHLSGGQQQRLCIARALALEPEVLLMDEPCSSLDPLAAGVVEDLIAGLRGRYTIAIVTHNLAQARRLADETTVFWLRDGAGAVIEQGPTERVFSEPRDETAAAYLRGARG
ncbi:MAG: phosphate ABC transporter ATP-binding protein [Planctomycetota bacterium]